MSFTGTLSARLSREIRLVGTPQLSLHLLYRAHQMVPPILKTPNAYGLLITATSASAGSSICETNLRALALNASPAPVLSALWT